MRPTPRAITLREITGFYLPLIFMTELIRISHSIINAALARQPGATTALAAYNLANSLSGVMGSVLVVVVSLALAFLVDRRSVHRVLIFSAICVSGVLVITALMVTTPLGAFVFGTVLGGSPQVTEQATWAYFILQMALPIIMVRDLCMGVMMFFRRTIFITVGVAVRIITVLLVIQVLPQLLIGATIGAASFLIGVTLETLVLLAYCRPLYLSLPRQIGLATPLLAMAVFAWPLILVNVAEWGLILVTNVFLGRTESADHALAAFGVLYVLLQLLLSPMKNLDKTAQALVRHREDVPVFLRFSGITILIFTGLLLLLFYTPLRGWVLGTVMGLDASLLALAAPAALAAILLPGFWGADAACRGLLIALRQTRSLAYTSVARLATVTLVGSSLLWLSGVNGVVIAVMGISCAFAVQAGLLALRLRRFAHGKQYFARLAVPDTVDSSVEGTPNSTADRL